MRTILYILVLVSLSCTSEAEKNKNNACAKAQPELQPDRYNVAFLIMDGTYNTELTAPFDIFQHLSLIHI